MLCEPKPIGFDSGGFSISGAEKEPGTFDAVVFKNEGWGGSKTEFEGVLYLKFEKNNNLLKRLAGDGCLISLVDSVQNPSTRINLSPGKTDSLVRLNGIDIPEGPFGGQAIICNFSATILAKILERLKMCQ